MLKILLLSVLVVAMIGLMIPSAFAENIEDIMSDYKLKGDAYSRHNHPYMAFLNYDKANLQSEKDTNYNKWNEYKIFFESIEENTENYTVQELQDIIEKSNQMGDYPTTIKYSDIAIEKYPASQHAYNNQIRTLTFMGEYEEAWNTLEKAGIDDAIPIFSGKYTEYKIELLFAMGNYEGALAFFENWVEYVLSVGGYGLPPGSSTMLIAMAYEKLGYSDNAQYWYEQDYLNTNDFDIECQKASHLHSLGLYQNVVEIMEKNNTYQNCRESYLYSYIISKDIVTGQYIPPIEYSEEISFETPLSEKSIGIPEPEDICGKGTIMKDGQCVPEQKTKSSKGGGCLIATAAFGSEMAPQVQFLRELRDNTVLQTTSGTSFMNGFNQFYYSFSPAVADYERENPVFKEMVKVSLTPLLTSLTLLNYVEIDTEEEMLGYGISIILLNIGMYFVLPAAVILQIKRWKSKN